MDSKVWIIGGLVLILALGGVLFYFGGYAGESVGKFTQAASMTNNKYCCLKSGTTYSWADYSTAQGQAHYAKNAPCGSCDAKCKSVDVTPKFTGGKETKNQNYATCNQWDHCKCYYCGDGKIDPGEICDDGNSIDKDGCSKCTCFDSDGGLNPLNKAGVVKLLRTEYGITELLTYPDECITETGVLFLKKWGCSAGKKALVEFTTCPSIGPDDSECIDGVCVNPPVSYYCCKNVDTNVYIRTACSQGEGKLAWKCYNTECSAKCTAAGYTDFALRDSNKECYCS